MIELLFGAILCGIAAFAITYELRYTDGPFDVFENVRRKFGIVKEDVLDDSGLAADQIEVIVTPTRFITKLYRCYYCLVTWVSLLLSILLYVVIVYNPLLFVLAWFCSVGIAFLSYRMMEYMS